MRSIAATSGIPFSAGGSKWTSLLPGIAEAVPLAEKNQKIVEETQAGHPMNTFPMRMNLGRALAAAKQFERARSELLAVEESLKEDDSTPPHQTTRIREVLHDFYLDWDKPEEAARWMVDR